MVQVVNVSFKEIKKKLFTRKLFKIIQSTIFVQQSVLFGWKNSGSWPKLVENQIGLFRDGN